MTDIATLAIKCDSSELGRAKGAMGELSGAAGVLEGYIGSLMAVFGAGALAKQIFDTNVEFQSLKASLETVTGSSDAASRAFDQVKQLAIDTPFQLAELTQAFIDLKVRGMDASTRSLLAYGDMASSFGRSIGDTIRAIAGVTVGETEAIKSFGVTAQSQGNKIALTFKGQTEIVNRSTAAVEAYFQKLAEANYGGGMARQMNTLGGALSNLKDQIAATFYSMGNAGLSSTLIGSIQGLTSAIASATPSLQAFASSSVSALVSVAGALSSSVKFLWQWKAELIALAGIAFAVTINGWISAIAGLAAPLIRATALTIALELETLKYASSCGIASVASAGFKAVLTALLSPAGLVTIALVAMTIAVQRSNDALEKAEQAAKRSEAQYSATYGKFYSIVEKIKEMNAETEKINNSLKPGGGGTTEKSYKELDDMVDAMTKTGKFSREEMAQWVTSYKKAAGALDEAKAKQEAHNKAIQEAAEASKKLAEERKNFLKDLKLEAATFGMTTEEVKRYKAEKLGLGNSQALKDLEAMQKIRRDDANLKTDTYTYKDPSGEIKTGKLVTEARLEEIRMEREARADAFAERQKQLEYEQSAMQAADDYLNPYLDGLKQYGLILEGLKLKLDQGVISQGQYNRAFEDLVKKAKADMPVMTSLFGDLRDTIQNWSQESTDAFVDFCFTGESSFKQLVDSMLRDLARLAVQKNIMGPLFSAASDGSTWSGLWSGISGLFGGGSTGSVGTTYEMDPYPLMSSPSAASASGGVVNSKVSVTVNQATGKVTTDTSGASSAALGKAIDFAVQNAIREQMRQGGSLAR